MFSEIAKDILKEDVSLKVQKRGNESLNDGVRPIKYMWGSQLEWIQCEAAAGLGLLRCTKLELASLAQEAKDLLNTMTESGERDIRIVEKSAMEVKEDEPTKKVEREKIVISIQDKGGCKQFRVYMDENFERLFKMYAEKLKLKLETLVFSFDGERVNPSSTPAALGLRNDDIIEVNFKAC
ncbi:hypothetical protein HPP92_004476 [Vanilla planifolia]|uniref:Rad60/SUMO-like domain-containing protein n=1 Tax=Vanilla planifolia TaxID=51239 RepID=A0A835RWS9_VANPL|nr:hypothetical protein HPP92_004476 [Vanilla planifolia]